VVPGIEELKILASTKKGPKIIEIISSDTQIPLDECRIKIAGLVELGLLVIDRDSDLYGHEVLKFRRVSIESE
jgi:hypothetical protein